MKKIKTISTYCLIAITISSCATLFGGPVTDYQKTKPASGERARQVRIVPLIADVVLFWPSLIVDFATGAIYKPLKEGEQKTKKTKSNEKLY